MHVVFSDLDGATVGSPSSPSSSNPRKRNSGRTRLETPASIFKGLTPTPKPQSLPTITRPAPTPVWPWVTIGIVIGTVVTWIALA